ncbi:DNA helicase, partial [Tanacetum coccineum]
PLGESSESAGSSRPPIDEIQNYLEVVQILVVHLEDMQCVTFRARDNLKSVVNLPSKKNTMLTKWFAYNTANVDGRHLTYLDFSSKYVWYADRKSWSPRQNSISSIGRLAYVHPTSGHGGTGKTFLWKTIISTLRSEEKSCKLLHHQDEAPMNDRRCFEALDRTLRDILDMPYFLFGGEADEEDPENTYWVNIPPKYCLPLVKKKAIVYPRNETADSINSKVLEMVQGESITYVSQDEATPVGSGRADIKMLYPVEHLNTLKFSRFPSHRLELKVGAPVMLLRNINLAGTLCNGTRMIVRQLMTKLIKVQIISGTRVGEKVFIHRISLIHKELNLPFIFKRRLATTPHGLKILIEPDKNQPPNATKTWITIQMELSTIAQLTPTLANKTLEAKVYRKWIAKSPPEMIPFSFCCILLDREVNAIQANMALKDVDYFSSKLQIGMVYMISNFICEAASRYQQTLKNKTSLRFGRYTHFDNISPATFLHHYFEFTSNNQLESKIPKPDSNSKMQYPVLTGNVLIHMCVLINKF